MAVSPDSPKRLMESSFTVMAMVLAKAPSACSHSTITASQRLGSVWSTELKRSMKPPMRPSSSNHSSSWRLELSDRARKRGMASL